MDMLGGTPRPVRRPTRFAVGLTIGGIAWCGLQPPALAEDQPAAPPPVPLYSAHVSRATTVGPGMMVISTKDPFDTVVEWYRVNLKDQMAEVAMGPKRRHYLTHNGAGVDVSASGSGADAETKISLFWKTGRGAAASATPPVSPPTKPGDVAPPAQPANVAVAKPGNAETSPVALASIAHLEPPRGGIAAARDVSAALPAAFAPLSPLLAAIPRLDPPQAEIGPARTLSVSQIALAPLPPALVDIARAGPAAGKLEAVSHDFPALPPAAVAPLPVALAALLPPQPVARIEPVALDLPTLSPVTIAQLPVDPPVELASIARLDLPPGGVATVSRDLPPVPPRTVAPLPAEPAKPPVPERDRPEPQERQGAALFRDGRYAEALLAWQDAAAKGGADAALSVGMMFDAGQGVPQSYPDALSWYQMAAEQGSGIAAFNAGVIYDAGFGVRQNATAAAYWYAKAAAKGSGRAAFNLALLYERGDGVPQDGGLAARYFRQADRLGVAGARDHLRGRRAVRTAAEGDDDRSFNTVHTVGADAPDSGSAAAMAQRNFEAAGQGDPAALYNLAYCLEHGIGVEINLRQAYMLYRKTAYTAQDGRLREVAEEAAAQIKAHLATANHAP